MWMFALWLSFADVEQPSAEQIRFFETSIRPVLAEHCLKCHGADKQWSNLRLDSREALLKGGDGGPAIDPLAPEKSRLILAVRQTDPDFKMPPEGMLSDREIADLTQWIAMGTPFPAAAHDTRGRSRDPNHWAFQAPVPQPIPVVDSAAWPLTAIDNFILNRLESESLFPAVAADKPTLLRRITFDLIGLPPTPEEMDDFLSDNGPDAVERLTDRLLASPHYGERWGRHWLDVSRYADSNGLDENVAHGNAWRYRDYVVAAFNQDRPFDRFIVEQLAGDLQPFVDESQRHELLIATGFVSIGPKVLAEVNMAKMQMDIVDEQIDTVGRVFLGMTFGCARCHDHKFDPIDTADYYGLAGVFKSTRTMETYTKVAKWHEHLLPSAAATALQAEYQALLTEKKQAVEKYIAAADQQARESLPADAKPPEKLETLYPDAIKAELARLREELAKVEKNPPELPAAMGVTEDAVTNVAIHIRGNPLKLGEVVARHVPAVMHGPTPPDFPAERSGRQELAAWLTDPRHPLTSRVLVNRVWRWHFGRGIVPTTENFGLLGEKPSHPELLDWLAQRWVADGWSVKSLHRLLIGSRAYQQSSRPGEEMAVRDPDNHWFGRANVRRLEAEEFRDALLAISGSLDTTMGGSLLNVKNRAYFFDHTSIDKTDYSSRRRALYLPIVRNNVYDLFQLLDFPDPAVPTGDRAMTTVPTQALLMLNSDLVMQAAEALADQVLADAVDDEARLSRLYQIAWGRPATRAEQDANQTFLLSIEQAVTAADQDQNSRRRLAWTALCHVVLAANEFLYLR